MRFLVWLSCVACPTLTGGAVLAAQQASPYVPLQHWTMPSVEHLIATGVLRDPSPLTRPLRRVDLVRALTSVDTVPLRDATRATVRRLLAELEGPAAGDSYRIAADGGLAAATYSVRDPLSLGRGTPVRPFGPSRAFVSVGVTLEARFGSFVAVTHPYEDTRLRFDPDWYDSRRNGVRVAEGYLSGQWRYGELFFGLLDRNWGPSGVEGLLLSAEPYGLDHLAVRVGTSALQLQGMVTQLDTRTDATGAAVNRYMFQHRFYLRPRGRWTVALWEGSVWSGVGRQLEPWYVNLLNLGWLVQPYAGSVNNLLGLDFERRGAVTAFGQFMLDDIQIDRKVASDLKPASYGLTLGAKGGLGRGTASWTAFYTQVANLTYRNEDDLQGPLYHFLGTGRNFADYDQLTARLNVLAGPGLLLGPELTLLRQGEGDPRQPHPPVADYPSTPTLFQGVVERTVRVAWSADWALGSFTLRGNGGVHFVHNAGHVSGASATHWVGSVGITYRLRYDGGL